VSEARDWLRLVAAAHAAGAETRTEDGVAVHRVKGGYNNALYQIEADGVRYACKLCVADGRHRAAQEYGALRTLHAAGLDIAPGPLWLDESRTIAPFPAVIYRWLSGAPLQPPLTANQLAALLDSIQHIHALRSGDSDSGLRDSWFHKFDFGWYLAELGDFLEKYGPWLATTDPAGPDLRDRLMRLIDHCAEVVAVSGVDPGREHVALCLCRVDANLANSVWGADKRLRWVDWEFSGWGDPALDLSDLRWHAALAGLSEAGHRWLRDNYRRPADDLAFDERLAVWDHIIATRWPLLILRWLWSQYHGPDRVRLTQPTADPAELRARLVRFIERAEHLARRA
jgi:aminoglycoside phosphotransferase (APT) family kinase protein